MFDEFQEQIQAEARTAYPKEAVWLITETGCRQVENIHAEPEKSFEVSQAEVRRALAEGLKAVVHSHPDGQPVPSAHDMRGQVGTGVPWGVLTTDGVGASSISWWGDGVPKEPLVGRSFRHGITDCYALVKDYYEIEHAILLPEFPRNWQWWEQGENLLDEGFASAGFRVVEPHEARPGDVWFAQLGGPVPNHVGILLETDLTLHQIGSRTPVDHSRLSAREPIYRYLRHIVRWLRHKDLDQ